jgi:hypothetical protein
MDEATAWEKSKLAGAPACVYGDNARELVLYWANLFSTLDESSDIYCETGEYRIRILRTSKGVGSTCPSLEGSAP